MSLSLPLAASSTAPNPFPTLPQHVNAAELAQRQFQLSLARTSYNYMRSYLEPVPLSADLPKGEEFSLAYEAKVLAAFLPLAENFKSAVIALLQRELQADLPTTAIADVEQAYAKLQSEMSWLHPVRDVENTEAFFKALAELPQALKNLANLPKDLEKMVTGLDEAFKGFIKDGPTSFLKSTLFDMLCVDSGRNFLLAQSEQDYRNLFVSLDTPEMLAIAPQGWMPKADTASAARLPCQQDWFFGYLQIAGFNTTNLRGVVASRQAITGVNSKAVVLSDLLTKMPLTDAIFQRVIGNANTTLEQAALSRRLYVCDYVVLDGASANVLHGEQRYLAAPIAVFYCNPDAPAGYAPTPAGVMQPVAIQLAQQFDAEASPIFTPNDSADANDANGLKWAIAKFVVNTTCAIQHESVAHLGDCHLIIEPIVVAAHRQLAQQHPLLKLLIPHFRFTININDSAIHSLIVPGGVVATNVGPAIECTLEMLAKAHMAWRWDENNPEHLFALRGVDKLADFPFRDDTLLLWAATKKFVGSYLKQYYLDDQAVQNDAELQAWVNELVSPLYAAFQGLGGLVATGNPKQPVALRSLDYLIDMVAQIVYIAGPQHASVNYAQYPLMSYMPAVAGTIYHAMPTRSSVLATQDDCLAWYPPLDVGLYTFSFEYLLSQVQFDTFGHYGDNPRQPYFDDPKVIEAAADFQAELAQIEATIAQRNKARPMPYPFQLPSRIPNSISI